VEPNLIRPKDDAYWRDYRGTPKAFVCLAAGQRLWGNRYGDLTAVRWALAPGALERIEESLREHLDPAGVGFYFQPVRQRALAAADQAMDFGQLFLGLSLFLIASALILTSLLFVFGVQQRTAELGTLLAVGLSPSHVRGLMLGEGLVLAVLGAVLGAGGGVLYTRALLWGLSTIWKGAVAGAGIQFHADPLRILAGSGIGAGASMCAMWLALRRLTHRPARELLAGESAPTPGATRRRKSWALTIFLVAAGGGIAVAAWRPGGDESGVATFFTAGTLILVAGMALWFWRLNWDVDHPPRRLTLSGLGSRNAVRRPWRSLAVVALLGSGSFLLITVAANVRGSPEDPVGKIGGTGGFDLYAESTLPVVRDLNDPNVRKSLPIDPNLLATLARADVVPLRVRPGDDASCLNLNRAQTPRLLGVHPGDFTGRFSFVKTAGAAAGEDPWGMLKGPAGGDEVPGIGDEPTVVWGLDKRLGDTVDYVDERGRPFRVRIVGIIAGSILQGNLLISRGQFEARFPSETGYRAFLVDCLTERPEAVSNALRQALGAEGLTVMPAGERLADFNAVQNAYLTVFAVLGGLGMLLGTVGLGLVVMRNVLERRAELAILRATGFPKGTIRRVLLAEHWRLLGAGALCGCAASMCVVLPGLTAGQIAVPVLWMSGAIAGIFLSGAFWTWLATRWATRGPLLDALRNE
jgi:ABC-type antimicrobial peptide transport system permease subunit